jgi:hypothetical protein
MRPFFVKRADPAEGDGAVLRAAFCTAATQKGVCISRTPFVTVAHGAQSRHRGENTDSFNHLGTAPRPGVSLIHTLC